MTIWYVTTGISLWESSRCWTLKGRINGVLQAADDRSEKELSADNSTGPALLAQWAAARRVIKNSLEAANAADMANTATTLVKENFRPECWSPDRLKALPAELATLWGLFDQGKITGQDHITLIQGDSNKTVAFMLQAMLVTLVPAFKGRIGILGPYGLDPLVQDVFHGGVESMWSAIFFNAEAPPCAFVLTGGYKALLIAIARRAPAGTALYYSHETDPAKLIQLTADEQGQFTVNVFRPS